MCVCVCVCVDECVIQFKLFIVRCNHNNYTEIFVHSHQLCHINNLIKLN